MFSKIKRNKDDEYDVKVTDKNGNFFVMTVAGNLDLYWIPQDRHCSSFEIDSADELTFSVFNQLFDAIQKVDDKYRPTLSDDTITFISEDRHEDYANILRISRGLTKVNIEFINNPTRDEWEWGHRDNTICFCNSGSRVPKVEHVFMVMFNKLAYECDWIEHEDDAGREL